MSDPLNQRAFYTVELRKFAGYDQPYRCVGGTCPQSSGLPGEGILIMRVDSTLAYPTMYANVVDGDRNGNVNDAGAVWIAGEEFTDGLGTRIRVESIGASTASVTISTGVPLVSITTATLPEAVVGQLYQRQLTATGGTGVFDWSVQGGSTLPAGLSLSASGLLSGTPSVGGTSSFTVVVSSGGQVATRLFSLVVAPVLMITTPATLPSGVVGSLYSVQLVATGGSGSNSWSISDGSTLPPGLSLSSSGLLSGTPSMGTIGSHHFSVTNGGQTATRQFTLSVDPPLTILTPSPLPSAGQGVAYSQTLSTTGGNGVYVWTVQAGSALPAGMSLSTVGVLSGTPTATGTFSFTLQVGSGGQTVTRSFALTVHPALAITTNEQLSDGNQGVAYSQSLLASGGGGGYVWSLLPGNVLPPGLTLSQGGLLSGTPSASGVYGLPISVTSGGQSVLGDFVLTILASLAITTPSPLPSGTQGVAYNLSLAATGGTGAYAWAVQSGSSLPAGLSLSLSGILSGTPSSSGNFGFTLQVASGTQTVTRAYTLGVTQSLAITTAPTLPSGSAGVAYTQSMTATGGSGSYTWSIASGSTLPAGLVLSGAGTISGTPTASGSFGFTLEATSGGQTASRTFTLDIIGTLTITTLSPLQPATVGLAYTQTIAATGGAGGYSWSVLAGSVLPNGLTLSGAGVLSGTPTSSGSGSFTLQVSSGAQTATRSYSLVVNASLAITTPVQLPSGAVGVAYSQQLAASGGAGGYSWSVAPGSSLPTGLTLSTSGLLSGSPTAASASAFSLQVTSGGETATRGFTLDITQSLAVTTPSSMSAGSVGTAYSQTLSASGGSGGYTWSLTSGNSLPPGLTLTAAGVVSGTPTTSGDFGFTIQVSSGGQTATRAFTLAISGSLTITTSSPLPSGMRGAAYNQTFSASGGTGNHVWALAPGSMLPAGLTLTSAGLLSGTPSASGSFGFTIQVTSGGQTATRAYVMDVTNPSITITTPSPLPIGLRGTSYSVTFAATGGSGSYTWAVQGGTIPPGLSLASSGAFGGTPSAAGDFAFTLQATSAGQSVTKAFTMTVNQPNGAFRLTVTASGSGSGVVLGPSAGISCARAGTGELSGTCFADLTQGTTVSLTASAGAGSTFLGWTGACSGIACDVVLSQAQDVVATFESTQSLVDGLASALLGGAALPAATATGLDVIGNANGVLDVGDLVALLDRSPGASLAPAVLTRLLGGPPHAQDR